MTITLDNVGSGYKRSALNGNFEAIEAEINNNLLNKNGGVGLEADLDANSQKVINLANGINNKDAVNLWQLRAAVSAAGNGLIASQKEVQTGADVVGSVTTFTGITYTVACNNLFVFRNGNFQTVGIDYTETSSSSITWISSPNSTDSLTFITNLATTNSTTDTAAITHSQSGTTYNLATYLQNRHVVNVKDFGAVGDGVTDDIAAIQAAIDAAESGRGKVFCDDPSLTFLITSQITVKHGVEVDFNNAKVKMDHTGSNNDSPFQMGNNTKLKNISELSFRSSSTSTFTTLGLIKIGEFYAELSGAPSTGDNSFDSTYWNVSNVEIDNVHGVSSYMTLNTDRNFTSTVYIFVGDNIRTNNVTLDGLASDSIPVEAQSVVRTESGLDINLRQQGFNIIIENTTGTNLRAHPENAVVYINGDRNTKVTNVHGQDCGQIFACNTNGTVSNQSSSLRGKNGVNIKAENITGFDCKIYTGDTFSKLTAGVNIKAKEPDLITGNRSQIYVDGVHLESTQTSGDKLSKGILINDNNTTLIDAKRVKINDFEVYYFPEGLLEDTSTEQTELSNGHLHHNDGNGATLRGIQSTYNRIKFSNNNQSGSTDGNGFSGHGVGLQTKGATFNECIFGDDTLSAGGESQIQQVQVSANDSRAVLSNCRFGNYRSGYSEINLRGGITGADVYIDARCRGENRSIVANAFDRAPDVVKVSAFVAGTGTATKAINCTTSKVSTGRYRITFNNAFDDTNYRVLAHAEGGVGANINTDWSSKTTTTVDIYTKNSSGTLVDADFDVCVWGNYGTHV